MRSRRAGHLVARPLNCGVRRHVGFIAKLLGAAPKSEWGGLRLDRPDAWEVSATQDRLRFLRALPTLLRRPCALYFEGTTELGVEKLLAAHAIKDPERIAIGTIWPRPKRFHVPCTVEFLQTLARQLESEAKPYLCTHLHAYAPGSVLLEWHDAFGSDPMRVSREIEEAAVSAFAQALQTGYVASGA
jgi:hypothetical protein